MTCELKLGMQLALRKAFTASQCLDHAPAGSSIACLGDLWGAHGKELLLLQLDALPRRVAQHHIEAGGFAFEDFGELQPPVEETVLLGAQAHLGLDLWV